MPFFNTRLIEMLSEEGGMSYFSLVLFKMVAERTHARFIAVELGVDWGHSCISMQAAIESVGYGHLHSCDIRPCGDNDNVKKAGLGNRWTFTQSDAAEFAFQFADDSVDFVFLDTSHEYADTVREISIWTQKLRPGGRMTFHDTMSRPDGVGKPIAEFLARNPTWRYYNIDVDCGFGVLDKPK